MTFPDNYKKDEYPDGTIIWTKKKKIKTCRNDCLLYNTCTIEGHIRNLCLSLISCSKEEEVGTEPQKSG